MLTAWGVTCDGMATFDPLCTLSLGVPGLQFSLGHWSCDGDTLVISYGFKFGLVKGTPIDCQAIQWYTMVQAPDAPRGFRVSEAHMLLVDTMDGKTSSTVWPQALETIPMWRGRKSELNMYVPVANDTEAELARLRARVAELEVVAVAQGP